MPKILLAVFAGLGMIVLAGCSPGPAAVPVPSAAPVVAAACTQLIQAMPATVLDQKKRKTSPESPLTTAYGDPAIEVTCGVAAPVGSAEALSLCFEVNGVGWFAKQVHNGYIFTTIGRELYLEMAVPSKYSPEANALLDVADVIHSHDKLVTPCS
jgi:hypothetical protein